MSGYTEILDWVEDNVELESFNTPESEYDDINQMFLQDNRSSLDHILAEEKPLFISELREMVGYKYESAPLEERLFFGFRSLFT
jgi:hypothetical protein